MQSLADQLYFASLWNPDSNQRSTGRLENSPEKWKLHNRETCQSCEEQQEEEEGCLRESGRLQGGVTGAGCQRPGEDERVILQKGRGDKGIVSVYGSLFSAWTSC